MAKNKIILTYSMVENRLSRETEKAVWAMIRDGKNKERLSVDIRAKLGDGVYPAFDKLMSMGAIERVQRGLYKVSDGVSK